MIVIIFLGNLKSLYTISRDAIRVSLVKTFEVL